MPFYEYRCENCRQILTASHGMFDAPLTRCPNCGRDSLVRLISRTGFTIKQKARDDCGSCSPAGQCHACSDCPHRSR